MGALKRRDIDYKGNNLLIQMISLALVKYTNGFLHRDKDGDVLDIIKH